MAEKKGPHKEADKNREHEDKVIEHAHADKTHPVQHDSSESIEIPVGKFVSGVRNNPWMIASIVLAIALIVVIILFAMGGKSSGVGEKVASEKLLAFINSQGNGNASLVSAEKAGSLYQITVNYQGQDIPVFVTLDGDYLITDRVPLTAQATNGSSSGTNTNTGTNAKVEVTTGTSAALGSKNASVTIVEFSDFQCPFCRKFWQDSLSQLKKEYIDKGKVKLYWKDFPLDFHPGAIYYAQAARCAKEKGGDAAFWKMHDKIFEEQNKLDGGTVQSTVTYVGDATLKKWAKDIGYDISSCLDSGKYKADIQTDLAYGQSLGVSGTPGFFVNGISVEGAQPYSVFKQIIDSELSNSSA